MKISAAVPAGEGRESPRQLNPAGSSHLSARRPADWIAPRLTLRRKCLNGQLLLMPAAPGEDGGAVRDRLRLTATAEQLPARANPPGRVRHGRLRGLPRRSTRISPIPGIHAAPNATRPLSLRSSRPRPSGSRKFRSRWQETRFPEIALNGQFPDTNGSNSRGLPALRRCRLAKPGRPYGSREKPADDSLASGAPLRLDIRRSFGIRKEVRGRRRDGLHRRPRLPREGTHSLH